MWAEEKEWLYGLGLTYAFWEILCSDFLQILAIAGACSALALLVLAREARGQTGHRVAFWRLSPRKLVFKSAPMLTCTFWVIFLFGYISTDLRMTFCFTEVCKVKRWQVLFASLSSGSLDLINSLKNVVENAYLFHSKLIGCSKWCESKCTLHCIARTTECWPAVISGSGVFQQHNGGVIPLTCSYPCVCLCACICNGMHMCAFLWLCMHV